MVAPLADLQISVVLGREFDPLRRYEVQEWIMWLRQVLVHRIHDLLRGVGSSDGQYRGVHCRHQITPGIRLLGTQTPCDDDAAIFSECFTDCVQTLLDRIVDKPASVNNYEVCTLKGFGCLVTLRTQLSKDQLGIGQCFRATQADKADFGCSVQ